MVATENERRSHPRFPVHTEVRIHPCGHGGPILARMCSSLNLSEGGIRLRCAPLENEAIRELIASQGQVVLGFRIGLEWFRILGVVVSVRCDPDGEDDVRVTFLDPHGDEVARLRQKLSAEYPARNRLRLLPGKPLVGLAPGTLPEGGVPAV